MRITIIITLIIAGLLFASSSFASSIQRYWQLTMSYDEDGLRIISAVPIPITKKAISSPGLGAAAARIPYEISWLNASGGVIQETSTELPVGYRSAPDQFGGPCETILPTSGIIVLRLAGPELTAAPTALRFARFVTTQGRNMNQSLPPAFAFDSRIIRIESLVQGAVHRDGPIRGVKLHDTGTDLNRIVFVILGDGYTQADLDAGLFSTGADNILTAFLNRSPWDLLMNGTNMYRIDVASNESGSDNDPYGTYKDTYFNSTFWADGTERAVGVDKIGYIRAINAADAFVGPGLWNYLLMLVNSTKYGGLGGAMAVFSAHPLSTELALHETGHVFAKLADEYTTAYPGYVPDDREPNVDYDFSGPSLKWLSWVTPGVPLPTPNSPEYSGMIGAFEGARYQDTGIYRPSYNCLMRTLSVELDAVCQEAHVQKYLSVVSLVDTCSPPADSVGLTSAPFMVQTVPLGPMTFQWKLRDSILPGATGPSLTLTPPDLYAVGRPRSAPLQLTVTYQTSLVHSGPTQQVISWTVETDCNGNGRSDSADIKYASSTDNNHNLIPDECDAVYCCVGTRGNVDGFGIVDLSDLAGLVSYLTGGGFKLRCEREANVNGLGIVDLSDLSLLINYLTAGGLTLPNCP